MRTTLPLTRRTANAYGNYRGRNDAGTRNRQLFRDIASRLEKREGSIRTEFFRNADGLLARKARLDGAIQVLVPQLLRDRVLNIAHYPASAGHPGGRRLFYTLRQAY